MKVIKQIEGNIKASIDRVALVQDAARMMGAIGAADALNPVESWLYTALHDVGELQHAYLRAIAHRAPKEKSK